jgi:thioredoxin-related protein
MAQKNPKKILVDVYTKWCGPCKMMDKNTFTDAMIIKQVSKNFHAVKFNAEDPNPITFQGKEYKNPNYKPNARGRNATHQLSRFFEVPGYPTLVVMDENMKILGQIVGYKRPEQLSAELARYFDQ